MADNNPNATVNPSIAVNIINNAEIAIRNFAQLSKGQRILAAQSMSDSH